jgi:hypothetical protein
MEKKKENNLKSKRNYWKQRRKAMKLDRSQVTLKSETCILHSLIRRVFKDARSRKMFHMSSSEMGKIIIESR